jgi:hypothetical protein
MRKLAETEEICDPFGQLRGSENQISVQSMWLSMIHHVVSGQFALVRYESEMMSIANEDS